MYKLQKKCWNCNGAGQTNWDSPLNPGYLENWSECEICKGEGWLNTGKEWDAEYRIIEDIGINTTEALANAIKVMERALEDPEVGRRLLSGAIDIAKRVLND